MAQGMRAVVVLVGMARIAWATRKIKLRGSIGAATTVVPASMLVRGEGRTTGLMRTMGAIAAAVLVVEPTLGTRLAGAVAIISVAALSGDSTSLSQRRRRRIVGMGHVGSVSRCRVVWRSHSDITSVDEIIVLFAVVVAAVAAAIWYWSLSRPMMVVVRRMIHRGTRF